MYTATALYMDWLSGSALQGKARKRAGDSLKHNRYQIERNPTRSIGIELDDR
jgi:hypothetical protein